jgi:hypothetical protein
VTRYRFEFIGVQPLPLPAYVYRETPIVEGRVELYQAGRFLVESVDHEADPPVAVLRRVRS